MQVSIIKLGVFMLWPALKYCVFFCFIRLVVWQLSLNSSDKAMYCPPFAPVLLCVGSGPSDKSRELLTQFV